MKTWKIELIGNNYPTTITVNATDEATARSLIMKFERCPERSILSIKEA
jgi:hypothetical protein